MDVRERRRPVTVSFSGLDGAGKSRQIEALVASMSEGHSVEVVWLPLEVWPQSLLKRLPAGFRSRLGPRRPETSRAYADTAPRAAPAVRRPGLGRLLLTTVWVVIGTLAAISVGLSLRRRSAASSADLLVLDRYRLDSMVKLQSWYTDVPGGWLARIVGSLAEAPDVEFLLRVDPEVAYARKPEQFSVTQLSTQSRLYDRLATRPMGVVTLDAHRDADELAREVHAYVRACLDGR
jgi:thymidylate kinase